MGLQKIVKTARSYHLIIVFYIGLQKSLTQEPGFTEGKVTKIGKWPSRSLKVAFDEVSATLSVGKSPRIFSELLMTQTLAPKNFGHGPALATHPSGCRCTRNPKIQITVGKVTKMGVNDLCSRSNFAFDEVSATLPVAKSPRIF